MKVVTRFAPSPTGHVHIGNMRSAIYSWLFARHHGGEFILRLEDTDRERSTPDAVKTVLAAMEWLGLTYDGEVEYQSSHVSDHLAAAARLVEKGHAYRAKVAQKVQSGNEHSDESSKGQGGEVTLFRIPWNTDGFSCVREAGEAEKRLHPEASVDVGLRVACSIVNKKGDPALEESCLAGFKHMRLLDASGKTLFELDEHIDEVFAGASFSIKDACLMTFVRREVYFKDLVKGVLSKPLDDMKDLVMVRGDNTPVFHLANVCDDARRGVTHIIRGDDHVENTFRHILLFNALGAPAPEYAHLPMVVNANGKPYSKRDGDAFVGDFREQGYFAEALFNYLVLLGYSPGDDREMIGRDEMIALFDIARIRSAPTQVDLKKLSWLNGAYMTALPRELYEAEAKMVLQKYGMWGDDVSDGYFKKVLDLMAERIKLKNDFALKAGFFFTDDFKYDDKAVKKRLEREGVREGLVLLKAELKAIADFNASSLEVLIQSLAEVKGVKTAEFIHPLRVSVSGLMEGPGLFDMLELLGRERVCARIERAVGLFLNSGESQ